MDYFSNYRLRGVLNSNFIVLGMFSDPKSISSNVRLDMGFFFS